MNYIILCDTTYQILSAISFRIGNTNSSDRVDLLVDTLRTRNVDMNALAHRIKESNVFSNVYCINNYQGKYENVKPIIKILEWLFPRAVYNSMTKKIRRDCDYDAVVVSGPFSTQRCLIAAYPHSRILFIEDGLGSYIGRLGINELSWRGKIAQKLCKYSPTHIFPEAVYLYSPKLYVGEYKPIIRRLNFPISHMEVLSSVFFTDTSSIKRIYGNYKFIYFSQLINPNATEIQLENTLIEAIKRYYKDDFIIRPHPRGETAVYDGLNVDASYSQWELCCSEIDDTVVLIGNFSTALFIPKLLYNAEPTVIFTYKIYGNNYVDAAVKRLQNLYSDKKKVVCVSTMDELLETIESLKKV